jgi:hypothetical protein
MMSSSQNEGDQFGDDAIRVSNDGLEVVIDLTVLYRVSARRSRIFKEIGVSYKDKIVRPVTSTYP